LGREISAARREAKRCSAASSPRQLAQRQLQRDDLGRRALAKSDKLHTETACWPFRWLSYSTLLSFAPSD